MTNIKPTPTAVAMIICDMVMDDRKTGKKILVGTFNNINAHNFPIRHPELHIFLTLTNGHGRYQAALKCIKSDTDETILDLPGAIEFVNPLHVVEIDFDLKGLMFRMPGEYLFQLLCDGQVITSRKFMVSQIGGKINEK
jgi:hypothetical protein